MEGNKMIIGYSPTGIEIVGLVAIIISSLVALIYLVWFILGHNDLMKLHKKELSKMEDENNK